MGHGNPWEIFVLGMRAFGLQGVGGKQDHIIFNGKQGAKEIGSSKQLTVNHTPGASLLVIKRAPVLLSSLWIS